MTFQPLRITRRGGVAVAIAMAALGLGGCSGAIPRQTPFMENVGDIEMSSRELRVRVVEFGRNFSSAVEATADEIMRSTADQRIRRNALRWKIEAIPAAQEAVLQVDPLMSLVDIWGFAMQMRDFYETGDGAEYFGEEQALAIAACEQIERDVEELARRVSVSGVIDDYRAEIRGWASNHPIRGSLLLRDSVIGSGAELLGEKRGAFALVEDMNATTREMANRLAFYNEYLLKQVGWTAEMMTRDVLADDRLDSLSRETFAALTASTRLMDGLPALAESERRAVLEAAARERTLILQAIDRQRVATLESLRDERIAAMEQLSAERREVLEALQEEREIVMNEIKSMMAGVGGESRAIVDHAVWRLGQLLVVLLAVLLVIGAIGLVVWRVTVGATVRRGAGT